MQETVASTTCTIAEYCGNGKCPFRMDSDSRISYFTKPKEAWTPEEFERFSKLEIPKFKAVMGSNIVSVSCCNFIDTDPSYQVPKSGKKLRK